MIVGYFQSYKYLDLLSVQSIKSYFYLNESEQEYINNFFDDKTYVSLHVRRTDYLQTPDFHTNQTMDYYNQAINHFCSIDNICFLIFSDDINYCKKTFVSIPCKFTSNKNYIDLMLMSKCHHNIIANSSFSWWGAYLNENPNKIVIAPKKWVGGEKLNTNDLCPPEWIRI